MISRIVLTLAIWFAMPLASAEDINGFWKHTDQPGWIEIRLEEGKGTVVRNDKYPERVGRKIVKDLKADDAERNLWRGQVYAEISGEFRKVEVTLPEPGRMEFKVRVGFRSRTIEWVRVDEVPSTSPE